MDKDHLDSGQDHARVDVLELWNDPLANVLRLLDIEGNIIRKHGQDGDSTPFGAFVHGHEQLLQHGGSDQQRPRLGGRLADFRQRLDRVCDHHGIRVANHLLERLDEAVLDTHCRVQVEKLGHADGGRLAHVGRLVSQRFPQRLLHVVDHLVHSDAPHCADGQRSYQRVRIFRVLHKRVDGENAEVWVCLCVVPRGSHVLVSIATPESVSSKCHRDVHEIEIDQLLLVQVGRRNVLQDVGEQGGHILAQRHGHDGLLDGLLPFVGILRDQTSSQLKRLSFPRRGKGAPDAIHRHRRGASWGVEGHEDGPESGVSDGWRATQVSCLRVDSAAVKRERKTKKEIIAIRG